MSISLFEQFLRTAEEQRSAEGKNIEISRIDEVKRRLYESQAMQTIKSEYGLEEWQQMDRLNSVVNLITENYADHELEGFWCGLEWGYTCRERFTSNIDIETREIALDDANFKLVNNFEFELSGTRGLAHLVGYIIGAEMAGVRITTDVIATFAIAHDMSPNDVLEVLDRHNKLDSADEKLREITGQGVSLLPARRSTIPTVQTNFKGQLELARGAKEKLSFKTPEKVAA